MATERYIHGKHDTAHHVGRYSNVKAEMQAEVDESVGEQLIVSINVVRQLKGKIPDDIYAYHLAICDTWLERSEEETSST